MSRPLDLICVGRCMVDLYCDQVGSPVAQGQSLSMYIGGCPTNIAVGTSRQGLKVAMLTRVGAEATGDFVINTLAREGIDTSHVRRDAEHRTPMVVAGIEPPAHFPLTWYRERTADLAVVADDFDDAFIGSSQAVLMSGNSLSTDASAAMVATLVQTARRVGTRIIYDIDFRPVLWRMLNPAMTEAAMAERMQGLLPVVDLLVGTEEEYQALMHLASSHAAFEQAHARAPGVAIMKLGKLGALVAPPGQPAVAHAGCPVPVYNTLGAGDAFLSGFLSAWLRAADLAECARRANASGALVVTRHGCAPAMPYAPEIDHFLTHTVPSGVDPRDDARLNRLHTVSRQPLQPRVFVRASDATVPRDSKHTYLAGPKVAAELMRLGLAVFETLNQPDDPLTLAGPGSDPGLILRERPRALGVHTFAAAVGDADRSAQRLLLRQLQAAVEAWDRDWLLELVGDVDPLLDEFVGAGVAPHLWLLPCPPDRPAWERWTKRVGNAVVLRSGPGFKPDNTGTVLETMSIP